MPPLMDAIRAGDIAQVQAALSEGQSPDGSESGRPPLLVAMSLNQLEIFNLLLDHGANPNRIDKTMLEPIFVLAIQRKKDDFINALLDHDVDVDLQDPGGSSALWEAYDGGNLELFKEIAGRTKNINQITTLGRTCLHKAAESGNEAFVQCLLLNEADANLCDDLNNNPLLIAVMKKHYNVAKLLVAHTKDLENTLTNKTTVLQQAIDDGEYEFAIMLVEAGANVNVGDFKESILHKVLNIEPIPYDVVDALIAHGANCNALSKFDRDTPLHIACKKNLKSTIMSMLKHSSSLNMPDKQGDTAFMIICRQGDLELIEAFLQSGADPNWPDTTGETPLYAACKSGNAALVNLMLKYGGNPHIMNTVGKTSFNVASTLEDKTILELLQAVHLTPEMQDQVQQYKLAYAYSQSLENMSKMIILGLETEKQGAVTVPSDIQVICNNEGYGSTVVMDNVVHGGKLSMTVDGQIYPVGYNIYIPEGVEQVTKVVVSAYGGFTKNEIDDIASPTRLFRQAKHMLQAGCVVIELNLPDYLQTTHQFGMDADLHKRVHAAIDQFYKTISQDPLSLHMLLEQKGFQGADYFLFGASYGGRTAARHGQLYPHTFKGYIAHDGAFAELADMCIVNGGHDRRHIHPEVVYPIHHTEDTVDPILIMQNRDDNNVNLKNATQYYAALQKAGKGDLARLCFFEKGNPIPEDEEIHNKGHFYPEMELSRYMDTILNFIDSGPSQIPELHQHLHLRQRQLADQFFRRDNDKERFLALALQRFKDNQEEQDSFFKQTDDPWDDIWSSHYRPMLQALGEMRYLMEHDDALTAFIQSLDLTDEVITKAVRSQAAAFREYYKETHDFEDVSEDNICNNPHVIRAFREQLTYLSPSVAKDFKMFLLESLFFANPELLPSIDDSLAWTQEALEVQEREYRQIFEASARESKASMQQVWQSVIKKVIGKQRSQRSLVDVAFDTKNIHNHAQVYQRMFLTDTFFVGSQDESAAASAKIQTDMSERLTEINQALIQSIESLPLSSGLELEVVAIAKPYLMDDQAKLSEDALRSLADILEKKEHLDPLALELLANILIMDKARDPFKGNEHKAMQRQSMLNSFIQDRKIQYEAEQSWLAEIKEVYPDLNTASVLRLNSIIKRGIETPDYKGQCPLVAVIQMGDTALAKVLIELGADVNKLNLEGSTTLELACKKDDFGLVKMLNERGVEVTDKCLINAQNSSPEIIKFIIEQGAKLLPLSEPVVEQGTVGNIILNYPIIARLANRALVEDNPMLNETVLSLVKTYECEGQFRSMNEIVSKLMKNELTEDEMVEFVETNQLDVDFKFANSNTLLMYAIDQDYNKLVQVLIEKGVQLDVEDQKGFTAIQHALYKNKLKSAEIISQGRKTDGITENDSQFGQGLLSRESTYKFNFRKRKFPYGITRVTALESEFKQLYQAAIEHGNLEQAIELLGCALDLDTSNSMDEPLISAAIKSGATQFAICLLKAGASANGVDMNGESYLAMALKQGNNALVRTLVEHGASVNAKNLHGKTCLDIAMSMENTDMIDFIMQNGIDVNAQNENGESNLLAAIGYNLDSCAFALIERGANVNVEDRLGNDVFSICVEKRKLDIARAMIQHGLNLEAKDWKNTTPLIDVCQKAAFELATDLIAAGANVNAKDNNGRTPLTAAMNWAERFDDALTVSKALVVAGADVNTPGSDGMTAFWAALEGGFDELAISMIEHGADVTTANTARHSNSRGMTPMMYTAEHGSTAVLLALLKHDANVDERNFTQDTPLMIAAEHGHVETALALLDNGADLSSKNQFDETPLFAAIKGGSKEIVAACLEHGAAINDKNNMGDTPLAFAVRQNNLELACLLIDHGADPGITNNLGMSCLMLANDQLKAEIQAYIRQRDTAGQERPARARRIIHTMHSGAGAQTTADADKPTAEESSPGQGQRKGRKL